MFLGSWSKKSSPKQVNELNYMFVTYIQKICAIVFRLGKYILNKRKDKKNYTEYNLKSYMIKNLKTESMILGNSLVKERTEKSKYNNAAR